MGVHWETDWMDVDPLIPEALVESWDGSFSGVSVAFADDNELFVPIPGHWDAARWAAALERILRSFRIA